MESATQPTNDLPASLPQGFSCSRFLPTLNAATKAGPVASPTVFQQIFRRYNLGNNRKVLKSAPTDKSRARHGPMSAMKQLKQRVRRGCRGPPSEVFERQLGKSFDPKARESKGQVNCGG